MFVFAFALIPSVSEPAAPHEPLRIRFHSVKADHLRVLIRAINVIMVTLKGSGLRRWLTSRLSAATSYLPPAFQKLTVRIKPTAFTIASLPAKST